MENNDTYEIVVNLKEALDFVESPVFNNFLMNNTTLSIGSFISEVLIQTIEYMMNDETLNTEPVEE